MEPTVQPLVSHAVAPPVSELSPPGASGHDEADEPHVHRGDLVRIGLVALAVVLSWLVPWQPFPRVNGVALIATLAGGYPIYKEAFEALRERRMTMELSMTIALVAA